GGVRRVAARRARRAGAARARVVGALRLSSGLPGALLREAAVPLRPTRARGLLHLPRDGARRGRARRGAGAPLRRRRRDRLARAAERLGALGVAILDRVAEAARDGQERVQVEVDRRARLLRDLVLDGQVEVVGAVLERTERLLVLRQHRRADVLDVVEEDAAQRDVAPVLARRDLAAAERRAVRLVRPAEEREEAGQAVAETGVLEVARALQVLEPLLERLVEADHHRRRR